MQCLQGGPDQLVAPSSSVRPGCSLGGPSAVLSPHLQMPVHQKSEMTSPARAARSIPGPASSQAPSSTGAARNKRSDHGSLANRTVRGNETASFTVDRPLPAAVHVWVRTGAGEVAGLLAGSRRDEDGAWCVRVIPCGGRTAFAHRDPGRSSPEPPDPVTAGIPRPQALPPRRAI